MITVLKGSPQYSIDNNGVMTITTTWMVMPDTSSNGISAVNWLAFETEVETWAGNVGDRYKKPVIPENGKEATEPPGNYSVRQPWSIPISFVYPSISLGVSR